MIGASSLIPPAIIPNTLNRINSNDFSSLGRIDSLNDLTKLSDASISLPPSDIKPSSTDYITLFIFVKNTIQAFAAVETTPSLSLFQLRQHINTEFLQILDKKSFQFITPIGVVILTFQESQITVGEVYCTLEYFINR